MVKNCCVKTCKNRHQKRGMISFFTFPRRPDVRLKWLLAVQRTESDLLKSKDLRVCSQHFAASDFIFGGNVKKLKIAAVPNANMDLEQQENIGSENVGFSSCPQNEVVEMDMKELLRELASLKLENKRLLERNASLREEMKKCSAHAESEKRVLLQEMQYVQEESRELKEQVKHAKEPIFSLRRFQDKKQKIFYYTGFETYAIMEAVFALVRPAEGSNALNIYDQRPSSRRLSSLSCENQFFLTMIRLRRGLNYETLGDMFEISKSTAGKICLCWINLMFVRLGALNIWPSRDVLLANAPPSLEAKYENLIGSIDCTEFFIEKPSSLIKQSQCYSNYKSCTTVKSLVMTDTNGGIIYMSPLFTGSISDKGIVEESGFLDILKDKINSGDLHPGDVILADKGFNIRALLESINITLNIPTFKMSGVQFSEQEVAWIREIAHERIHVERSIGRLKQYRILTRKVPVALLGTIEQIYTICCILTSFRTKLRS